MSALPLPFLSCISTKSPPFSFSLKYSSPPHFSLPFQRVKLIRSISKATSISFFFLTANVMAQLVNDKDSGVATATFSAGDGKPAVEHSRIFLEAQSEEEILSGIKKEVEAGRLPSNVAAGMEDFYRNYKNAVFQSGDPAAAEIVLSNMADAFDRMLLDVEDPFVFQPYHKALREPSDYYMFGQNYIRPLIDFKNSYVGNLSLFHEIDEKLKQGHNVVLISNHQTEADPAVIALLLEKTNPHFAENLIYVAGDRVITDPLCKPFSMGRNLVCVYSKKHMFDVPELADMKRKSNIRSLKEMAMMLRTGSKLIWIAPSGGRDRPDPVTGEWTPAPFDVSSVDNMRRLIESSGAPGHIYPLALLCYDIMPPPSQVEKEIGERRLLSFHGVGLSVAPEITADGEKSEEVKDVYTQALYKSVTEQYNVLKSAIHGKQGLEASTADRIFMRRCSTSSINSFVEGKCVKQIPDDLHSSRRFNKLCSGALRDGKINRFDRGGLGLVAVASDSRESPSFITGKSSLVLTLADARSFHILPS